MEEINTGESKSNADQLVVHEHENLKEMLYDILDPMPLDLIVIIINYDSYELKGKSENFFSCSEIRGIRELAELSNGTIVTVAVDANRFQIWDLKSDKPYKTFGIANYFLSGIASCSDNQLLSGLREGKVKLWDTQTGECKRTIETTRGNRDGRSNRVLPVSEDELLSCGDKLKLWDIKTGSMIKEFKTQIPSIWSLLQLSKNIIVFGVLESREFIIWDYSKDSVIRSFTVTLDHLFNVKKISEEILAIAGAFTFKDYCVAFYNCNNGQCIRILKHRAEELLALSNGLLALHAGDDAPICIIDPNADERCLKKRELSTTGKQSSLWMLQLRDGRLVTASWADPQSLALFKKPGRGIQVWS